MKNNKRLTPKKLVLDPLLYVDAQNIFFEHNEERVYTTSVYGSSTLTYILVHIDELNYIEVVTELGQKSHKQQIGIRSMECNFGGIRWWLICPTCEKSCRKLYLHRYYACRDCHNLTYRSKNRNRRTPVYPLLRQVDRAEKLEHLVDGLRSTTYDGRPTKRYKKIVELAKTINNEVSEEL